MQTWPDWESYQRYLEDERARECQLQRYRETFCHHGKNLVERCDRCGIEAERMESETHIQFCADGLDLAGEMYAYWDATEIRAWCEDGTLIAAVRLHADGVWTIDDDSERCGESIGTDSYNPRDVAFKYVQAARLEAVRIN